MNILLGVYIYSTLYSKVVIIFSGSEALRLYIFVLLRK